MQKKKTGLHRNDVILAFLWMGHLIGPSGIGKAQLTSLVEAIMHYASSRSGGFEIRP